MPHISAWLRSHRLTAIVLALTSFAVAVHIFANWRSEARWQRYCAEARARGVKLTLAEFTSPEIPDAENFAALPMFRASMAGSGKRAFRFPQSKDFLQPRAQNGYPKGGRIDFQVWVEYFYGEDFITVKTDTAPRDVLRGIEHYGPEITEWRGWRIRPHCQFPICLDAEGRIETPDMYLFWDAFDVFILRMHAHLAVHDSPAALEDFEDAFQACKALENPQTHGALSMRLCLVQKVCEQVGESLAGQRWSKSELRKIDAAFAELRPVLDYQRGLSAQRVSVNAFWDRLVTSRASRRGLDIMLSGTSVPDFACMLIPRRVFRDNQFRRNQFLDELLARVSSDELHFDPDQALPSGPENLNGFLDDYYFHMFKRFAERAPSDARYLISKKILADQTRLAIALERFRLARGVFPETLAELAPEFIAALPVDAYSGQPTIYRREQGGSFLLYGVGKNRRDDGGVPGAQGDDGDEIDDIWHYGPPAR